MRKLMLIKQVHQKIVSHYWYFLCYSFNFQPNDCKRCHDSLMMSMKLSTIAILNINGSEYLYIISRNRKSEAITFLENISLTKNIGTLQN